MPKLGHQYPWALGAKRLVFNDTPFDPWTLRAGDYFQDDDANRLLSQANNQKLPVYPTLPSVFYSDNGLVADNYRVGMRGDALDAAGKVKAWVSAKGPWLRTNRLLRRPRTLLVTTSHAGATFAPAAAALDAAWGAMDEGGWEAAVVEDGPQAAWGNFPDPFYLGLPVRAHDNTAAPAGDFAGAFGELVLAHLSYYCDLQTAAGVCVFPNFVSVDSTVDQENVVTVGSGTFTNSLGSHTWTLQRNALWHAAGPALFAEVVQNYSRFRMVVVNGTYAGFPAGEDTQSAGVQLAEAAFPAESLLRAFTGLDADHLTVINVPIGLNFGGRAGAALAGWVQDNLND